MFRYFLGAIIPLSTSNFNSLRGSPFVLTEIEWSEFGIIFIISLFVSNVNEFRFFKIKGASETFLISTFLIVDFPSSEYPSSKSFILFITRHFSTKGLRFSSFPISNSL